MIDLRLGEQTRQLGQLARAFVVERGLKGARAAVLGRLGTGGVQRSEERFVGRHALHAQRPELGTVSFDVRREDAGRGAGGAPARPAWIEHLDARAAPGTLEGHGTADDTGPDDDDAHEGF